MMQRPHVVILGAGASVAACLEGDKNGRRLPTMDNFVAILGLAPLLARHGIRYANENFEALYGSLYSDPSRTGVIEEIESAVHEYFSSLDLPNQPTLYDHLLLALRKKDAVCTFNWDPFLFDAWVRNHRRFELPEIFFLHGNARCARCPSHPRQWGVLAARCPECGASFVPTKLLYPIKIKNYAADKFIASHWEATQQFVESAFTLTIFGYSAPSSDIDAMDIMKTAWHRYSNRLIEHVEIIDLKAPNVLYETWQPFISYHHYVCRPSFFQSWIANYPRRSSEALYAPTVEGRPAEQSPIPKDLKFDELYEWLNPIVRHESN